MKNSNTIWIWLLIVSLGLSILSSFYTVSFSGFDYWFFLIAAGYIVISNVSLLFIEKAVINNSGRASKARRMVFKEYEFLDKNDLWDKLSLYDLALRIASLFSRVSVAYSICWEWRKDNNIKQHTEKEIREFVVKKQFSEVLKEENYPRKHMRKIKKMERSAYKPHYFWDKQYNKFKNGTLLNQSNNSSIYALISLLLSIGSIVTSIVLTINVLPETKLFEKLLFLLVLVIADIVSNILTIINAITLVEKQSKAIVECIEFLFKNDDGGSYDKMVINRFCNCDKSISQRSDSHTIEDVIKIVQSIDPLFFEKNY